MRGVERRLAVLILLGGNSPLEEWPQGIRGLSTRNWRDVTS